MVLTLSLQVIFGFGRRGEEAEDGEDEEDTESVDEKTYAISSNE
jgi:hypothetical protein